MYSILAAVIFSVIIVINFLIILGLPFGELTMGGQYKILPKNMRFVAVMNLIGQVFAIIIVLQGGGYVRCWFPSNITRIICYIYAGFLLLNSLMNFISKSKKERCIMTPLALVSSVCFFYDSVENVTFKHLFIIRKQP